MNRQLTPEELEQKTQDLISREKKLLRDNAALDQREKICATRSELTPSILNTRVKSTLHFTQQQWKEIRAY